MDHKGNGVDEPEYEYNPLTEKTNNLQPVDDVAAALLELENIPLATRRKQNRASENRDGGHPDNYFDDEGENPNATIFTGDAGVDGKASPKIKDGSIRSLE